MADPSTLPPAALDALVHERVIGAPRCNVPPDYSTDPAACMQVMREIERRGWGWDISNAADVPNPYASACVYAGRRGYRLSGEQDSWPRALCLAALAAVGAEEGRT